MYVIRKTPRGKPVVANVDKLKPYRGEPPKCWKRILQAWAQYSRQNGGNSTEKTDRRADGRSVGLESENTVESYGPQYSQVSENNRQHSGPRHSQPVSPAAENSRQSSGPQCSQPAERASENNCPHSGPRRSRPASRASENSCSSQESLKRRLPREKRRPLRYCCRIMGPKRRRPSSHHCQVCDRQYRSHGSCYRHMAKEHGRYYRPGREPEPIPYGEMGRLRRIFSNADRNSRQRRRDGRAPSTATSAAGGPFVPQLTTSLDSKTAAYLAGRDPSSSADRLSEGDDLEGSAH